MLQRALTQLFGLVAAVAMVAVVGPQVASCPPGTTGVAANFCNNDPLTASPIDVRANINSYLISLRKIRSEFDYPLSRAQSDLEAPMAHR